MITFAKRGRDQGEMSNMSDLRETPCNPRLPNARNQGLICLARSTGPSTRQHFAELSNSPIILHTQLHSIDSWDPTLSTSASFRPHYKVTGEAPHYAKVTLHNQTTSYNNFNCDRARSRCEMRGLRVVICI